MSFWHLSCLAFSDIPGQLIWGGGSSWPSHHVYVTRLSLSHSPWVSSSLFISFVCLLAFQFQGFYCCVLKHRDSAQRVQSADELVKGLISATLSLSPAFLFGSQDFHLCVFLHAVYFILEPLACINHSCLKFWSENSSTPGRSASASAHVCFVHLVAVS